jgi:hypothetical protein
MLRVGPVVFIAMLVALAEGLAPFSATAGPEHVEQLDPVVVTLPSRAHFPAAGAGSDLTVGPLSPFAIAREAQKELRRVGCYEGDSSGIWTPSSRLAAQRFVDRVNAKLPTDKPDEILLALLRDQSGVICGQCQRDQAFDPSGRCMPTALITKTSAPRSIATDSTLDNMRADRAPADQTQPPLDSTATRQPLHPANGAAKSWSRFIKKVDRALGLY